MVESVLVVAADQRMYILTMDDARTFYVGEGDWLVHNLGCGDYPDSIREEIFTWMINTIIYGYLWEKEQSCPTGVFSSYEQAVRWIEKHKLVGYLGEFPIDVGVYDWAMQLDYYKRNTRLNFDRQNFATGLLNHYHFTKDHHETSLDNENHPDSKQPDVD